MTAVWRVETPHVPFSMLLPWLAAKGILVLLVRCISEHLS